MAALLCSTFLFVCVFVFPTADTKTITAESRQNVTLTCRVPSNNNNNNNNIIVVEWSRADPDPDYVFVWRNKNYDPENQHPAFKNRVDLQDRQMKDGDVSVILIDVMINDTGTYECRVQREGDSMKLMNTIYLSVVPPPGPGGGTTEDGGKEDGVSSAVSRGRPGLLAVLGAGAVVVVVVGLL